MKLSLRANKLGEKLLLLSTAFVLAVSTLTASVPFILSSEVGAAPGAVAVRAANLQGWRQVGSGGSFTDTQAKIGLGSYQLTTGNSGGQKHIAFNGYSGTKLSEITELSYSSLVQMRSGSAVAPVLRIDTQLPGKNFLGQPAATPTTLVWEPANGPQSAVGVWQDYNPLVQGRWWASPKVDAFPNSDTYKTWAEIVALYPNATVRANTTGGVYLGAGQNSAGAPWSGFVGNVDNFKFNGMTYDFEPAVNPVINTENFNTYSGSDYEGVSVGFNIVDFGTVSAVSVKLYQNDILLATNTGNAALVQLVNNGTTQLSTPFITNDGTYVEEYWNSTVQTPMNPATKPTKAVVSVTGVNGTREATLSSLVEPNGWNFETLFSVEKPVHQAPSANAFISTNDFYFEWSPVPGAVSYELQNSQNPAVNETDGSFTYVTWTGDYQQVQPTEPRARSVGADGTWYWQVRAVDAYGNKSDWTTPGKVTIDLVAPTLSWQLQPKAVYIKNEGFEVRPITNEVGTIKSIYIDSASPANLIRTLDSDHKNFDTSNAHNQALWDSLTDGQHRFVAVFEDYAGNTTISASNTFVVDRTGPRVTVKPESVGSVNDKLFKTLSVALYDANKIDKVTINGVVKDLTNNAYSDVNVIKPGTLGAVEGNNVLIVFDANGNTTTYEFTLDVTAPGVTFTHTNNNDNTTVNTPVTSTLRATEPIATPAGWTLVENSNGQEFTKVSTQNNKGNMTVVDRAGNSKIVFFEVKRIDSKSPVISGVVNGSTVNGAVNLSVLDPKDNSADGFDRLQGLTVNGVAVATTEGPNKTYLYSISDEGLYTVVATDKAGNPSSITFTIDSTAPEITSWTFAPNTTLKSVDGILTMNLTATDNFAVTGASYDVYNEDGTLVAQGGFDSPYTSAVSQIDISGLVSGTYRVVLTVRDAANNTDVQEDTFVINNEILITLGDIDSTDGTPEVSGRVAWGADNSGLAEAPVTVTIGGVAYSTETDTEGDWTVQTTTALSNGPQSVHVVVGEPGASIASRTFAYTVAVPAVIVPVTVVTDNDGTPQPLTANVAQTPVPGFVSPAAVAGILGDSTEANNSDNTNDEDVRGVSTLDTVAQAVDADNTDGTAMGLAWYWWVLIAAGLALIGWWIAAAIRRRQAE